MSIFLEAATELDTGLGEPKVSELKNRKFFFALVLGYLLPYPKWLEPD